MMAARQKRGGAQSRGGRESEEKASRFLHLRLLLEIVRKSAPAAKRIATGDSLSCIFSKERRSHPIFLTVAPLADPSASFAERALPVDVYLLTFENDYQVRFV